MVILKNLTIGVISDIHGNWEAWKAVREDMRLYHVDEVICLGDMIGYGPFQIECLESVKKIAKIIIKGNHESYFVNFEAAKEFVGEYVFAGIQFFKNQFSDDGILEKEITFLKSLAYSQVIKELEITLAHGSYRTSGVGNRIKELNEAAMEIRRFPTKICFIGHTHRPFMFNYQDGWREKEDLSDSITLRKGDEKYLINIGSVGQPRDYDPRASYGILEFKRGKQIFTLRRIPYDVKKAQEAFIGTGLPEFSAMRIAEGE